MCDDIMLTEDLRSTAPPPPPTLPVSARKPLPPFILLELLVAYLCICAEILWFFKRVADFLGNCSILCFLGEGEIKSALFYVDGRMTF